MELYGTAKEQLGWMAINSRRNAALNPLAAYRDPITMDDYLAARPLSSPLGLLDCDVPVDGSIAAGVVPSPDACFSPADGPSRVGQGERQVVDDLTPTRSVRQRMSP